MKVSKLFKHVALGVLALGLLLPLMPAQASGASPTIPDSTGDVIDIIKHTQNSFRPSTSPFPSIHTRYQYACKPDSLAPFSQAACDASDLTSSKVASDSTLQKMTFTLTTKSPIPPRGAPITAIPAPFTGINYAWYFTTTAQERPEIAGINCTGAADPADNKIKDDFTVGNAGVLVTYTAGGTCPTAANADAESKGVTNGGSRNVLDRSNVMIPVHPKVDGWMAFVEVQMTISANGTKRLDGNGNLVCAGGAPVCIDYDMSLGQYEGYSGVSTSNSLLDFDPTTQPKLSFSISGTTITASIPWNPTSIGGADGDLLIDDARSFPWPLAVPGRNDRITNMVAEISGVVGVGANTVPQVGAVCANSTDNMFNESQEPIRTIGATEGSVNRTIGNTTDDVQDSAGIGTPQDDGIYLHGNGGTDHGDCIRGITGLLTLLDWTDNGFEIRIYPRNPAYLPNQVDCRYPIGETQGFLVFQQLPPLSAPRVGSDTTSPYNKPYTVSIYTGSGTPTNQSGTPVVIPETNPLGSTIGRDKPCNYSIWVPGIHYFDILSDITA